MLLIVEAGWYVHRLIIICSQFLYMFEVFHDTNFLKSAFKDSSIIITESHTIISLRMSHQWTKLTELWMEVMLQESYRAHKLSLLPHVAWQYSKKTSFILQKLSIFIEIKFLHGIHYKYHQYDHLLETVLKKYMLPHLELKLPISQ